MKANITIPNPIAQAAAQLADHLGISLSDLYTAALSSYVSSHLDDITESLNQVYETETSGMGAEVVKIQVSSLKGEQW